MNKEAIEKRLAELKVMLEQIEASGNATVGAIRECEYWLKREIEKPEQKGEGVTALPDTG